MTSTSNGTEARPSDRRRTTYGRASSTSQRASGWSGPGVLRRPEGGQDPGECGATETVARKFDPLSAIARARDLGIGPGMLGNEDLEQMLDATVVTNRGPSQPALGRVIAPMAPPPLTNPALVNGMPHWRPEDFPMDATDASIELMVHYDITGNSVTEGRMQDIQACFNDRLDRLGRMIREQLPGRPKPIGQIAREHRMHQGYENMVEPSGW